MRYFASSETVAALRTKCGPVGGTRKNGAKLQVLAMVSSCVCVLQAEFHDLTLFARLLVFHALALRGYTSMVRHAAKKIYSKNEIASCRT